MNGPDEIFDLDADIEYGDTSEFDEDGDEFIDDEPKEVDLHSKEEFEFVDDSLNDIDFSEFKGDFKSSLKKLNGKLKRPQVKKVARHQKPLTKSFGVEQGEGAVIHSRGKSTKRILVPREREVMIQGVDSFMLDTGIDADSYRNIGYYNGKKLKELILIFNNNSALDFNLELFNPSMMLDYLYSTGGNINNKVTVAAGTGASYSDVVHYMMANPTLIPNARIIVSGPSMLQQQMVTMKFKNKNIAGELVVEPLNIPQNLDIMQVQSTVISFDIMRQLNRPFIPDGMDVINYTILAGNTVTLCFYYKQKKLKKLLWKEARDHKKLM